MGTDWPPSLEAKLEIVNELGLHARAAAKIARLAAEAQGPVWIGVGGDMGSATDVLDILALGCPRGATIVVRIENESDRGILDAIARQVASGFDETE